ncbi:leucine-rich repeat domain-containing protein [Bacillus sp. E(2018)]|uniref:leucine-rich repeat domain-containing protein n=1 Tax=Bacillus sp. E(2018) TaxID=2502239 RepID=UPI0025702A19|nr:leucine-rich repeat domain-containing protein [Bacillus sp. E(2018)]
MRFKEVNNVKLRVWSSDEEEVLISDQHLNECIEYINRHGIKMISVMDWHYKGKDLAFLRYCPPVEDVSLDSNFLEDTSGLYDLNRLRSLSLTELFVVDGGMEFDLSPFKELESLSMYWSKKIKGIQELTNLKRLHLWKYAPKLANLEELSSLQCLEEMTITQSKVRSLKGIQELKRLRKLELNYLRTLTSIEGIEGLGSSLQHLDITSCKNIDDLDRTKTLSALEAFHLNECGSITSLDFITSLTKLKHFVFQGTNVLSGDVTPSFHIDYVYFDSKKHYSHKWKDIKKWTSQ